MYDSIANSLSNKVIKSMYLNDAIKAMKFDFIVYIFLIVAASYIGFMIFTKIRGKPIKRYFFFYTLELMLILVALSSIRFCSEIFYKMNNCDYIYVLESNMKNNSVVISGKEFDIEPEVIVTNISLQETDNDSIKYAEKNKDKCLIFVACDKSLDRSKNPILLGAVKKSLYKYTGKIYNYKDAIDIDTRWFKGGNSHEDN